MIENARSDEANLRSMLTQVRHGFRDECERLLDVFGATGRA
jgi:hypothetical protein